MDNLSAGKGLAIGALGLFGIYALSEGCNILIKSNELNIEHRKTQAKVDAVHAKGNIRAIAIGKSPSAQATNINTNGDVEVLTVDSDTTSENLKAITKDLLH